MAWTDDHGPDKLYDKFIVTKANGKPIPDDEFVFVLRPETDEAALDALYAYAREIQLRSPVLATQIRRRLRDIEIENRAVR